VRRAAALCVGLLGAARPAQADGGAAPAAAEDPANDHAQDDADEVIVVTGARAPETRRGAVVRTTVITREDIARSGAGNLADLLEQQAGIQLQRGVRGSNALLQGMSPDHVLVLIDGQRVAGRVDGAVDLSRLPTGGVEQVEVIRGPASTLYGADAMGGVINIITAQPPRGPALSSSAELGAPLTAAATASTGLPLPLGPTGGHAHASVGRGASRWGQRFGVSAQQLPSFDLDEGDPATNADGQAQLELTGQVWHRPSEAQRWTLRGSALRRRALGVDSADSGAVYDRRHLTETVGLSLGPTLRLGPNTQLQVTSWTSFFRDQYLLDQRGSTAEDAYQDTRDLWTELDLQLDHAVGSAHLLTAGLEGAREALWTDRIAGGQADRLRGAAFAQHTFRPARAPRLSTATGLRLDRDSQFGQAVSPKLALKVDATSALALRLSGGWGYKAPDFKDLYIRFANPTANYAVEGNPALRPERAVGANLAADWFGPGGSALGLEGYAQRVTDLIQPELASQASAGQAARYSYVNVAEARTAGLQADARARPTPWLWGQAGLTYGWTRDLAEDRPLANRPTWMSTASLGVERPRSGPALDGRLGFTGERPLYDDPDGDGVEDTVMAPSTLNLDARLRWRWPGGASVWVGGENLLDAGDPIASPLRPRQLVLGLAGGLPRLTDPAAAPSSP
jgi:outer membrane receptor for ferrienterochelin and colicins